MFVVTTDSLQGRVRSSYDSLPSTVPLTTRNAPLVEKCWSSHLKSHLDLPATGLGSTRSYIYDSLKEVRQSVRAQSGMSLYSLISNREGTVGDVAQMVERALRMREVKGSMPFFSIFFFDSFQLSFIFGCKRGDDVQVVGARESKRLRKQMFKK